MKPVPHRNYESKEMLESATAIGHHIPIMNTSRLLPQLGGSCIVPENMASTIPELSINERTSAQNSCPDNYVLQLCQALNMSLTTLGCHISEINVSRTFSWRPDVYAPDLIRKLVIDLESVAYQGKSAHRLSFEQSLGVALTSFKRSAQLLNYSALTCKMSIPDFSDRSGLNSAPQKKYTITFELFRIDPSQEWPQNNILKPIQARQRYSVQGRNDNQDSFSVVVSLEKALYNDLRSQNFDNLSLPVSESISYLLPRHSFMAPNEPVSARDMYEGDASGSVSNTLLPVFSDKKPGDAEQLRQGNVGLFHEADGAGSLRNTRMSPPANRAAISPLEGEALPPLRGTLVLPSLSEIDNSRSTPGTLEARLDDALEKSPRQESAISQHSHAYAGNAANWSLHSQPNTAAGEEFGTRDEGILYPPKSVTPRLTLEIPPPSEGRSSSSNPSRMTEAESHRLSMFTSSLKSPLGAPFRLSPLTGLNSVDDIEKADSRKFLSGHPGSHGVTLPNSADLMEGKRPQSVQSTGGRSYQSTNRLRVCSNCRTDETRQWVRGENNCWLCHSCGQFWRKNGYDRPAGLWNRPKFKRSRRKGRQASHEAKTPFSADSGARSIGLQEFQGLSMNVPSYTEPEALSDIQAQRGHLNSSQGINPQQYQNEGGRGDSILPPNPAGTMRSAFK